ncbi:hypothetical protein SAMN05428976_10252 [Clostridium sp. USBA 49]|jgi:hypothetical protein|nr:MULTISPECIES: hypothetical protein [Clostridium]SKA75079.1 hypothetical protein SAMN05428976_10252 [Clostridium sp. USBA 49]
MTNKKNSKANNKENKKNELDRPKGRLNNKKNPSTFEDFNGKPII